MRLLYTIGIIIYALGVRLASLFNTKAAQMRRGWRRWQSGPLSQGILSNDDKVAWFHASSLGEFEQARPVIEAFRQKHPDFKICLTFFSPSGYEIRKNYDKADVVMYLPPDTMHNARKLLELMHPDVAFFVKYDFWFNYLHELKRRGTATYLFSAIFRKEQYFFKWYGGWFARQLGCYSHLFVQNEESVSLLKSIGVSKCSIAGDTRFDRVNDIALQAKRFDAVEHFLSGDSERPAPPVIVAGSSWEPDEENLHSFLCNYDKEVKLILAPHMINESHLAGIERLFGIEKCIRYSQVPKEDNADRQVLIIDNMGMLSSIYRYATVAYIGGGFGKGIHNILEAAVFDKPVCFGPNNRKFQEAQHLMECGGAREYRTPTELDGTLRLWLDNPEARDKAAQACHSYIHGNLGATNIILEKAGAVVQTAKGTKAKTPLTVLMLIAIALLATSCRSVDKFIQPEDQLLSRNHYKIEMPDGSKPPKEIADALSGMKKYGRQKPNKRLLGTARVKMHIYCLSSPDKNNFWHKYLRRQGEPPVVYDENAARQTCDQLGGLLESKGCFRSEVYFDTICKNKRNVEVTYHICPAQRYLIDDVTFHAQTPQVDQLMQEWQNESLIRRGDYYDQDILAADRSRLAERLQDRGYYLATTDLITYNIDTAFEDHKLTIRVNLRNPVVTDSNRYSHSIPLQTYRLDQIYIYPNSTASTMGTGGAFDTMTYSMHFRNYTTSYQYLYNQPMTLSPRIISRSLFLFHGQRFRPQNIERTYNSLLNLRNFKYINIEFQESPNSSDTARLLDAKVRLLNSKRQRISASVELNNSSPFGEQYQGIMSGNLGLETKLTYQNKNLFGGAELFKAEWSLLIELPKLAFQNSSGDLRNNVTSFESGLDLSLDLPTFLMPFTGDILWQRMRPHTIINIGGNYQYRSYFERIVANTGFGYNWVKQQNGHQLLPIELTYVKFPNIDPEFLARLGSISDARLKYQYSDHFIMDARYDYVYNTQQYNTRNNFKYIHLSIETAGNLLHGASLLSGAEGDENGIHQFLGVPYSQYVRVNGEFKYYFYFGKRSTFVTRVMAGAGLPYANSNVMPYEKSFYGGGPTTIRAWHLRYLGPGTFSPSADNMFERVGDIQLVVNLEHRFPLFYIFEGALFADLGNVWLVHDSEEFPGGQFHFNDLYKSIATGIGFGIRANISILTIRCDLAIPLYDPGQSEAERWRVPYWRFNQVTANFGIDYPF